MALSYSLRVACVIALSLGLLQLAFEVLLRIGASFIVRIVGSLSLRRQERTLYLLQLMPVGLAILLTASLFLPQYVSNETNFASERVGWFCLPLAIGFYAWWAANILHGLRMALRTMLYGRACRRNGDASTTKKTSIVTIAASSPRVALVGLVRPFISISRSLLGPGGLTPTALQIVLDHERSHAAQRDNWKLLTLHCLPKFDLKLAQGKTWMQLWQSTAECAADEDAVAGNRDRAFLLAETLVALARTSVGTRSEVVCTYLVCEDTDLALRIDRLLNAPAVRSTLSISKLATACCFVALLGMASVAALSIALRNLPERLLHLG